MGATAVLFIWTRAEVGALCPELVRGRRRSGPIEDRSFSIYLISRIGVAFIEPGSADVQIVEPHWRRHGGRLGFVPVFDLSVEPWLQRRLELAAVDRTLQILQR